MKVCILNVTPPLDTSADRFQRLHALYHASDKTHELVQGPNQADLVLLCNLPGKNWFESLRFISAVQSNPSQCFAVSDSDRPLPLLHGVYTSAHKKLKFSDRFRSGAYNLYPQSICNHYFEFSTGEWHKIFKRHLFSFTGRDSSIVRIRMFQKIWPSSVLVVNTTGLFNAFGVPQGPQKEWEKKYVEILLESKFCVCPRGVGSASVRLFEAMRMGVAPIILSDDWIFPKGPDWSEFALIVPEKDVDRLYEIAKQNEGRALEMGRKARLAYETYFADEVYFNYLVDQMVDIQRSQKIPERVFWSCRHLVVAWWKLRKRHLMTK